MANDSSTGGFLAPIGPEPADDAALCKLIQPTIAGIAGLSGNLVRRTGQPLPGAQPNRDTTWCAFAVTVTDADTNPAIVHDGQADGGLGQDIAMRSETLEVSLSVFGPAAVATATRLRDGLGLSQNRTGLRAAGIAFVGIGRVTFVPDMENGQAVRRADLVFSARRMAVRRYAVRNIIAVAGQVVAGNGATAPALVTSSLSARS